MVLTGESAAELVGAPRSIILLDMPSPQLVVEVVSPGSDNESVITAISVLSMQHGRFQSIGLSTQKQSE
jgi:hypothetical protein